MDNPILLQTITVMVFCFMLSIGINHSFREITSLFRQPELLLRSLLSVIVLFPLLVGVALWAFELPIPIANGLAVLAAAPGAPLTTKRSEMAGGDPTYAASLQLTLALSAVVVTPVILAVFYSLFEFPTERVTPLEVSRQVAVVTFFPVILGLLLQRYAKRIAEIVARPLRIFGNLLFLLLVVAIVVFLIIGPDLRAKVNPGALSLAALLIIVAGALAVGHLMGGPIRAQRSSLAIASIARNAGLALFVTALSDYGEPFMPTLLAYLLAGVLVGTPYSLWSKRQTAKGKPS